jgi:hypothetical protein
VFETALNKSVKNYKALA